MEVVGRHALLFDDDATSAFVNSDNALVEWNSLKIDRYDVRHLLTSPPPPRRRGRGVGSDDLEEEINRERYLDLPSLSDQEDVEESENQPETVGFHAVGFSYGDADDSSNLKNNNLGIETSGCTPPFPVPELLQCLSPSEKLHQIIARTATFVSKHGGQSEIVLRVKQGDNPTFGFLMPGHDLHPYFRYLVDNPEFSRSEHEGNIREEGKKSDNENSHSKGAGGALSLLGSVYDSGEEEDGESHAKNEKIVSEDSSNGTTLHGSKNIESGSRTHVVKDDSESQTVVHTNKEKVFKVSNTSVTVSKSVSSKIMEEKSSSSSAAGDKPKSSDAGAEPLIFEPPSEMKTLISKLAEFVARNGKQFEANLIEQDVKHGRFPFLLPANKYHAYYLKVLQDAQEPKVNGKSSCSGKDDSVGRGKENESLNDLPVESDRKEKFKMVIGKSKMDAQETEAKGTQKDSGITVDAASAAAILQAATRGIKPSNLGIFCTASAARYSSEKSDQNGSTEASKSITRAASVEVDSSEAQLTGEQKRKAERLKRAKMFVAMLKSGNVPFKAGNSRGSSMEPHENEISNSEKNRDNADGKEREGSLVSADVDKPATIGKPEMAYFSEEHNIRSSKRKYRTRSEACEDDIKDDDDNGGDTKENDERHGRRKHRSNSKRHDETEEDEKALESKQKRRHRAQVESSEEDGDEDDSDEAKQHKSSKKSCHSSRHSSHRHSKKRHIDESDDEERDERYYRKRHRSSHDKHRFRKGHPSRDSKVNHRHDSSSHDENQNRDSLVKNKTESLNGRVEHEEGEIGSKVSEESKRVVSDRISREASVTSPQRALASKPSDTNAEIPHDLRAKIRAMLLATRS